MKGIALSRIDHGVLDKDKRNQVHVFVEGDKIDLPPEVMKALIESGAAKAAD